jgi:anti-sigma regulatory factor (Ser/Thr protein kinase)
MPAQPPAPRRPTDLLNGELSTDGIARWTLTGVAPRPAHVGYVRHQIRLVLQLWGLTELTPPAEILISELATNVVRHARTRFTITVSWDRLTLRVEVSDASPLAPRPQLTGHTDDEGGRGLLLVAAIATDWGVDLYPRGKTVWFTIRRDSYDPW